MTAEIALVAVNARYQHSSFGMRYLQANLAELEERSQLMEFTINERAVDVAEKIVGAEPKVVGIGVYIWNVDVVQRLVRIVRQIRPDVSIVLGGPEVSYEQEQQAWLKDADYVICGEGEEAFLLLCRQLLSGDRPALRLLQGTSPGMDRLVMPYRLYSDEDIATRVIYVEASRGCPYLCAFCLSSLDQKMREVDLDPFFAEMETLLARGTLGFKFIDRTFNLSAPFALRVLDFFYQRMRPGLNLHFEMVPERLPPELIASLARFPAGVVQLEVGVQTLNKAVAKRISRPLKVEPLRRNIAALKAETQVHLHVDLIAGLPGEGVASFAQGFDQLHALKPHEIQLGILKRLKGTPITRHTEGFSMVYSASAPFEVLQTADVSFEELQAIKRFARYWDIVVNNGQFPSASQLIWREQPSVYQAFAEFTQWLFERSGRTNHISLLKLAEYLLDFAMERRGLIEAEAAKVLISDLTRMGGRRLPKRLQPYEHLLPRRERPEPVKGLKRQQRHLRT